MLQKIATVIATAVFITTGLIILIVLWSHFSQVRQMQEAKSEMESYLVSKYDKQFEIKDPVRKGRTIGSEGYLESEASAVDDDIVFSVESGSDGFSDGYLEKVWERQARPEVEEVVDRIFASDNVWFTANINLHDAVQYDYAKDLDFYKAFPEVKSNNLLYGVHVRLEANKFTESEHLEAMYQLIEYVKSKEVDEPKVRYVVDVKDEYSMHVCSLYEAKLTAISGFDDLKGCFQEINGLEGDDIE